MEEEEEEEEGDVESGQHAQIEDGADQNKPLLSARQPHAHNDNNNNNNSNTNLSSNNSSNGSPTAREDVKEDATVWLLLVCTGGIILAYFIYGLLQERIMTEPYGEGDKASKFRHVELLVTINRMFAMVLALACLTYQGTPSDHTPFYKYFFASVVNMLCSWCQYESLEYISFPMQVVAKSSKIIFTMFMGICVRGVNYGVREYLMAFMITVGLIIYRLGGGGTDGNENDKLIAAENSALFAVGIGLIGGYVLTDGFVSNWQQSIFREHSVTSYQMMYAINTCSFFVGLGMLFMHDDMWAGIDFIFSNPECLLHVVGISTVGAIGQVFIFNTISNFGAVTYAIIMTCRQLISVLASIFLYHHNTTALGWVGLCCVFTGLILKVWGKYSDAQAKKLDKSLRANLKFARKSIDAFDRAIQGHPKYNDFNNSRAQNKYVKFINTQANDSATGHHNSPSHDDNEVNGQCHRHHNNSNNNHGLHATHPQYHHQNRVDECASDATSECTSDGGADVFHDAKTTHLPTDSDTDIDHFFAEHSYNEVHHNIKVRLRQGGYDNMAADIDVNEVVSRVTGILNDDTENDNDTYYDNDSYYDRDRRPRQ